MAVLKLADAVPPCTFSYKEKGESDYPHYEVWCDYHKREGSKCVDTTTGSKHTFTIPDLAKALTSSISGPASPLSLELCEDGSGSTSFTFNGRRTFILYWLDHQELLQSLRRLEAVSDFLKEFLASSSAPKV